MQNIEEAQKMDSALRGLAQAIDSVLKSNFGDLGFALIVFEFGDNSIGNYISNTQRGDMVRLLRETADRLEKRQDIPPAFGVVQ